MLKIRDADPNDFDAIASILSDVWPSSPIDATELVRDHETMEPHLRARFGIAEADGRPVGVGELSRDIGTFHPQRWTVVISVLPEYRRQGVGAALFDRIQGELAGDAVLAIESKAHEDDPDGQAFATSRGFAETKRDFVSELDIASCEPPVVVLPSDLGI